MVVKISLPITDDQLLATSTHSPYTNPMPIPTFGSRAEALAKDFLIKKGYQFHTQNFHSRYGEIDLIFEDKGQFIFVEVKARGQGSLGTPEEAVDSRKLQKIITTSQQYLAKIGNPHAPVRIDVIAITKDKDGLLLRHYPNVTS